MTTPDVCLLPQPTLPRCALSDLPRLLCGCPEHIRWNAEFDYDDLDPAEHAYLQARDQHPAFLAAVPVRVVLPVPEYRAEPWTEARNQPAVSTGSTCEACGRRPAGDAFACPECLDDLRMHLGDVPGLLADLDVMATRQAVVNSRAREVRPRERTRWDQALRADDSGVPVGRFLAAKGYDRPLHVERAVLARDELGNEVTTAVRAITEARGIAAPQTDVLGASRWLLTHLSSVGLDPAAGDICRGMRAAHDRALRTIDNVEEGVYLGLCDDPEQHPCRSRMYADPEQREHRCTTCGATYDVEERREYQRVKVRESLLKLQEIVDYSAADKRTFGVRLSLAQLQRWVDDGRLAAVGVVDEEDTYRAGDVAELAESLIQSRHEPVSLAQAADLLDIPVKTLYRWENANLLTATDPGRRRGKTYDLGAVRVVAHAQARA